MRLEQMRRDFVANVSHELRTPLTVVHGYLDMLDPEEQPEWAPILEEMRHQSQRMTQLVEDLLTLSRLERSAEHTSELQSLMRISYACFCLKQKNTPNIITDINHTSRTYNATH